MGSGALEKVGKMKYSATSLALAILLAVVCLCLVAFIVFFQIYGGRFAWVGETYVDLTRLTSTLGGFLLAWICLTVVAGLLIKRPNIRS